MQVVLDGYALPVRELKGTDPKDTLDLSGKQLGVASAIVIASLVSGNSSLTTVRMEFEVLLFVSCASLFYSSRP